MKARHFVEQIVWSRMNLIRTVTAFDHEIAYRRFRSRLSARGIAIVATFYSYIPSEHLTWDLCDWNILRSTRTTKIERFVDDFSIFCPTLTICIFEVRTWTWLGVFLGHSLILYPSIETLNIEIERRVKEYVGDKNGSLFIFFAM